VTPSASSLLPAIATDQNPVGFVAVTVHEICNPLDSANSKEAVTRPIRSFCNHVFRYSDKIVFILFENADSCVFDTVQFIFQSIVPEWIIVLGSIHAKDFINDVQPPQVFFLSSNQVIGLGSRRKHNAPHRGHIARLGRSVTWLGFGPRCNILVSINQANILSALKPPDYVLLQEIELQVPKSGIAWTSDTELIAAHGSNRGVIRVFDFQHELEPVSLRIEAH
jgi:WD40 repeat protein